MKYLDMHTHTTASDGILSPRELVNYAIEKGLSGLAITDHDTVGGLEEAINYANRYEEFLIIPGIELSTELFDEEVHILGYNIDYKAIELLNILKKIQNQRLNRGKRIIKKLQSLGISISYEELLNTFQEGVVGRPHIARIMVNKGYVKTVEEAFDKYLNKGCPAYVARYKLKPYEAIDLIRKVKGLAVLAHPGLIKRKGIINDIISYGIDGIEVYHPEHDEGVSKELLSMAQAQGMIITAGSDFHSPPITDSRHGDLGSEKMPIEYVISQFGEIVR